MASTRRPTYTSTGGRGPVDEDVISASRSVPEPAPQEPAKSKKAGLPGRRKDKPAKPANQQAAATANVVAFPEPKGKKLKRDILVVSLAVLAVVAGLLVAAVYSPVLALNSISVSGTRLLTPAQVQTALEPLHGKPLPQITDDEVARLLEPLVQVKSISEIGRAHV